MLKPICLVHTVEMVCAQTGATVFYPLAQYVYMGDVWACPITPECSPVFLRAFTPFVEGFHTNYEAAKDEATYKMWDV